MIYVSLERQSHCEPMIDSYTASFNLVDGLTASQEGPPGRPERRPCPKCGATGYINGKICPTCQGTGTLK